MFHAAIVVGKPFPKGAQRIAGLWGCWFEDVNGWCQAVQCPSAADLHFLIIKGLVKKYPKLTWTSDDVKTKTRNKKYEHANKYRKNPTVLSNGHGHAMLHFHLSFYSFSMEIYIYISLSLSLTLLLPRTNEVTLKQKWSLPNAGLSGAVFWYGGYVMPYLSFVLIIFQSCCLKTWGRKTAMT